MYTHICIWILHAYTCVHEHVYIYIYNMYVCKGTQQNANPRYCLKVPLKQAGLDVKRSWPVVDLWGGGSRVTVVSGRIGGPFRKGVYGAALQM